LAVAAAPAAAAPDRAVRALAADLLRATANPDGRGLLLRGREYHPVLAGALDARVVDAVLRLARLAERSAVALRDHPETRVRRAAAVLAARAHPLRAALDD
jgi:hypothetical protein